MARHRQLKAALHAEQCRRETAAIAPVRASIERMIAQIEAELSAIASELSTHEAHDQRLAFKERVMCERKGVARRPHGRCWPNCPKSVGWIAGKSPRSAAWRRAFTRAGARTDGVASPRP